jgi:hypothetical protein
MMMGSTQQMEVVAVAVSASASKLTSVTLETTMGYTMRYRILKTLLLVAAWISFGMNFEVIGSTLEDLKLYLNVDYRSVSFNLVVRNIGYLTVISFAGYLFDRFNHYSDLFMCLSSVCFAIRK